MSFYSDRRTSKTAVIPNWMLDPVLGDTKVEDAVYRPMTIYLDEDNVILVNDPFNKGEYVEGANYNYLDRLIDGMGASAVWLACEEAYNTTGNSNTALYYERMLQSLMNEPTLELHHILLKISSLTGENTQIFGTSDEKSRWMESQKYERLIERYEQNKKPADPKFRL